MCMFPAGDNINVLDDETVMSGNIMHKGTSGMIVK